MIVDNIIELSKIIIRKTKGIGEWREGEWRIVYQVLGNLVLSHHVTEVAYKRFL